MHRYDAQNGWHGIYVYNCLCSLFVFNTTGLFRDKSLRIRQAVFNYTIYLVAPR